VTSASMMSAKVAKDIRYMMKNEKSILKAAKNASKKPIKSILVKIIK
jgi:hypothetical protein